MKQIKIILGTAHLSSTPGKRSPDGKFREYAYSRKVCKAVQEELLSRGVDCVIDYEDDDMPGLSSSQELVKRVQIVNAIAKKTDCLYVSIHVNASAKSGWDKATGFRLEIQALKRFFRRESNRLSRKRLSEQGKDASHIPFCRQKGIKNRRRSDAAAAGQGA